MIIYSKTYWGIHLLSRWHGSAFPRVLPFSLLSAAITAVSSVLPQPVFEPYLALIGVDGAGVGAACLHPAI